MLTPEGFLQDLQSLHSSSNSGRKFEKPGGDQRFKRSRALKRSKVSAGSRLDQSKERLAESADFQ